MRSQELQQRLHFKDEFIANTKVELESLKHERGYFRSPRKTDFDPKNKPNSREKGLDYNRKMKEREFKEKSQLVEELNQKLEELNKKL